MTDLSLDFSRHLSPCFLPSCLPLLRIVSYRTRFCLWMMTSGEDCSWNTRTYRIFMWDPQQQLTLPRPETTDAAFDIAIAERRVDQQIQFKLRMHSILLGLVRTIWRYQVILTVYGDLQCGTSQLTIDRDHGGSQSPRISEYMLWYYSTRTFCK